MVETSDLVCIPKDLANNHKDIGSHAEEGKQMVNALTENDSKEVLASCILAETISSLSRI